MTLRGGHQGRDDQRLHHGRPSLGREPSTPTSGRERDQRPHHGRFPGDAAEPDAGPSAASRPRSARAACRDLAAYDQRLHHPDQVAASGKDCPRGDCPSCRGRSPNAGPPLFSSPIPGDPSSASLRHCL
ncbi:MAG: hypothetical protein MZV63_63080 [Marinilabiliales bacterium]|nr:hypothetical protein [Marinilabiliales bacterium]